MGFTRGLTAKVEPPKGESSFNIRKKKKKQRNFHEKNSSFLKSAVVTRCIFTDPQKRRPTANPANNLVESSLDIASILDD